MSNFELEIERLKEQIAILEKRKDEIPSFSFSKIRDTDLEDLIDIKRIFYVDDRFNSWFNSSKSLDISEFEKDLEKLLNREKPFLHTYLEEDLKVKFIAPVLNMVNFSIPQSEIRDFYEQPLRYETDKFIFNGTTDFLVATGVRRAKKPYFFIQEFKQGKEFSDPEPQLVAELIAGLEISELKEIKGAFIVGSIWNFVILEKIEVDSYRYYVSENFDSSKIDELKAIFRNLLSVKNDILKGV